VDDKEKVGNDIDKVYGWKEDAQEDDLYQGEEVIDETMYYQEEQTES
jgi:hypothetical protein